MAYVVPLPIFRPETPPPQFVPAVSGRQSLLPLNPRDVYAPPRLGQVITAELPPGLDYLPARGRTVRLDPPTVPVSLRARIVHAEAPPPPVAPTIAGGMIRWHGWPLRWGTVVPAEVPAPPYAPTIAARHFDPPASVQRTGLVVAPAEIPAPEFARPVMPSAGARTPNEPRAVVGRIIPAEPPPPEAVAPIVARSLPLMNQPPWGRGQVVSAEPPPAVDFTRSLTAPWPRAEQPARGGGSSGGIVPAELPPLHYAPALRGGGGR